MAAALKVVTEDGIARKKIKVKGRVMNWNTDMRLKKNRAKKGRIKRAYKVREHIRSPKEHSGSNVFIFVKAPTDQLKTVKSMLNALDCTHRVIEV